MKKILFITLIIVCCSFLLRGLTLKEMYDAAGPNGDYEKYIELETGITYTGGLLIGKIYDPIIGKLSYDEGTNVRIVGNGAILNLQGEEISISYCTNKLDVDNCIIINGNIRFRGINLPPDEIFPTGSISYCTFYDTQDYGIRLQGSGGGISLERNIIVNTIDTGWDFHYLHGTSLEYLPTGANFAVSVFYGTYGIPDLIDNWSFHSDAAVNADSTKHFVALCEYG